MEHTLKIWEAQYHDVRSGDKSFELRKNDRGYQKGDTLVMEAYDSRQRTFFDHATHPPIHAEVTYVLSGGMFGLHDNYVCMSIVILEEDEEPEK